MTAKKGRWNVIPFVGFVRYSFMLKYSAYVIHEIGIVEDKLGRGYGTQLLNSVPLPILLKCDKGNDVGNAFYKAIGMNCAGLTATKNGKPQIIWTKSS